MGESNSYLLSINMLDIKNLSIADISGIIHSAMENLKDGQIKKREDKLFSEIGDSLTKSDRICYP